MNQKSLIVIVGPTAIGKTKLSIELAKHFKTSVLSSDSRQFYKEMFIGTAVPSIEEQNLVKHYFIQNRSIFEDYSVGKFEKDALNLLDSLFQENDFVVMVGGSGLYIDAVTKGLDNFPDVDPEIRTKLKKDLVEKGIEHLQLKLKKLDHQTFEKIDLDNHQRLIRSLEICIGTGQPYSSFLKSKNNIRNFNTIKIGVTAPRAIIYERINQRVDIMVDEGLIEEAKKLYPYKKLNALQTVGYKELFKYFDNEYDLDFAISEIKKNTRRFAKRQTTWFKRDPDIHWFEYNEKPEEVIKFIKNIDS